VSSPLGKLVESVWDTESVFGASIGANRGRV
jgi:hypothetical protein